MIRNCNFIVVCKTYVVIFGASPVMVQSHYSASHTERYDWLQLPLVVLKSMFQVKFHICGYQCEECPLVVCLRRSADCFPFEIRFISECVTQ